MKTLFQYLDDARRDLGNDLDSLTKHQFKILNTLTFVHDLYMAINEPMINVEPELKKAIQDESLFWSSEDEMRFNSLKLLRMKSFGTI